METHNSEMALAGKTSLAQKMHLSGVDPTWQTHCLTAKDLADLMIKLLGADKVEKMSARQFTLQLNRLETKVSQVLRTNLASLVAL